MRRTVLRQRGFFFFFYNSSSCPLSFPRIYDTLVFTVPLSSHFLPQKLCDVLFLCAPFSFFQGAFGRDTRGSITVGMQRKMLGRNGDKTERADRDGASYMQWCFLLPLLLLLLLPVKDWALTERCQSCSDVCLKWSRSVPWDHSLPL